MLPPSRRTLYRGYSTVGLKSSKSLYDVDVVKQDLLNHFNTKKNEFYKELKDAYKGNLQDRHNLIAKAEELKESADWRNTADALKRLQQEWKKLGPVGHSDNQKTWKISF